MASIFKRPSGVWSVEIYLNGGKRKIALRTKSERDARRTADRIQAISDAKRSGVFYLEGVNWLLKVREDSPKLYNRLAELGLAEKIEKVEIKTLNDLKEAYYKKAKLRSYVSVNCAFANLLNFFGGEMDVSKITSEKVELFLQWLRSPDAYKGKSIQEGRVLSENCIARRIIHFRSFFDFAIRMKWCKENHFKEVRAQFQSAAPKWRYFTLEEFHRILECTPSLKFKVVWCLGRFAGVRGISEIANLHWNMIDFKNDSLVIRAGKKKGRDDELRTVPLAKELKEYLLEYRATTSGKGKVFPEADDSWEFGVALKRHVAKAGFGEIPQPWYNQRRSFCSDVMQSGVDPKVYEAICGHSFAMGMKHYQILHPERLTEGFQKVQQIWG